jgi:hypothetical protein
VDTNVTEKLPKKVVSRFELAAARMADAWLRAGRVTVSREDLQIARDFLEQAGWVVRDLGCGLVELTGKRGGPSQEMSFEALVLLAMRRLAGQP